MPKPEKTSPSPPALKGGFFDLLTLGIDIFREEDDAVVSITDSGKGIPDEIRERIFEPFFTTKGMGEGSGLGLDIVRKIIDRHQGEIEVDSQPGKTVFSVLVPISEEK